MDPLSLRLVNDTIRRESRSLLQYVTDAFPWITPQEQTALVKLRDVVKEQKAALAGLGSVLYRRHLALPYVGTFPADFTTINYVSLDHLLGLLVEFEAKGCALLEQAIGQVSDMEANDLLKKYLELKRRYLQSLKTLATAHHDPAVVVK